MYLIQISLFVQSCTIIINHKTFNLPSNYVDSSLSVIKEETGKLARNKTLDHEMYSVPENIQIPQDQRFSHAHIW